MGDYSKGDTVAWNWGGGTGTGTIKERFTSDVERTIKGSKVSRKASSDEPAYLIEQEDGDRVLKSGSELKAHQGSSKSGGASSQGGSLDDRTKDELYEKAKDKDVEGRSDMNKGELVDALRDAS